MVDKKAKNLFFTTTFWLIVLAGFLYAKPTILAIVERGFTAERGFDLTYGLIFGAIATKKKMEQENVYTPNGVLGRNKSDVIEQQIAQPALDVAESIQPISQAIDEVQSVIDVLDTPIPDLAKKAGGDFLRGLFK